MEASALKPVESARLNMDDMPPETIRARDIEGRMSCRDAGESFLKKHLMLLERSGFLWNDFTNFQGVPRIKKKIYKNPLATQAMQISWTAWFWFVASGL